MELGPLKMQEKSCKNWSSQLATVTRVSTVRQGFSLIEMALAFTLLSSILFYTIGGISRALQLEIEAKHLQKAMALAKNRMNEVLSDANLRPQESSGLLGETTARDQGYPYELVVRDDKLDLSKALFGQDSSDKLTTALADEIGKNLESFSGQGLDASSSQEVIGPSCLQFYNLQSIPNYAFCRILPERKFPQNLYFGTYEITMKHYNKALK